MISATKKILRGVWNKTKRKNPKSNFEAISWIQQKIIKHQEDQTIKNITRNGMTIYYRRPYELLHTYDDLFRKEIYRFIAATPTPLIVDCGANIGLSVLYYKQLFPSCIIHAFEPDERNFALLQQNVVANNLQTVHLYASAVWIHDGVVFFDAEASEASHIKEDGKGIKEVPAVRLNSFLERTGAIDFLKVDIEGAEWTVMKDVAPQLHLVRNMFLEYHGKSYHTDRLKELLELIEAAGFQVYIKMAADNLDHPFVQKQTDTIYDVQLNIFCYRN